MLKVKPQLSFPAVQATLDAAEAALRAAACARQVRSVGFPNRNHYDITRMALHKDSSPSLVAKACELLKRLIAWCPGEHETAAQRPSRGGPGLERGDIV